MPGMEPGPSTPRSPRRGSEDAPLLVQSLPSPSSRGSLWKFLETKNNRNSVPSPGGAGSRLPTRCPHQRDGDACTSPAHGAQSPASAARLGLKSKTHQSAESTIRFLIREHLLGSAAGPRQPACRDLQSLQSTLMPPLSPGHSQRVPATTASRDTAPHRPVPHAPTWPCPAPSPAASSSCSVLPFGDHASGNQGVPVPKHLAGDRQSPHTAQIPSPAHKQGSPPHGTASTTQCNEVATDPEGSAWPREPGSPPDRCPLPVPILTGAGREGGVARGSLRDGRRRWRHAGRRGPGLRLDVGRRVGHGGGPLRRGICGDRARAVSGAAPRGTAPARRVRASGTSGVAGPQAEWERRDKRGRCPVVSLWGGGDGALHPPRMRGTGEGTGHGSVGTALCHTSSTPCAQHSLGTLSQHYHSCHPCKATRLPAATSGIPCPGCPLAPRQPQGDCAQRLYF